MKRAILLVTAAVLSSLPLSAAESNVKENIAPPAKESVISPAPAEAGGDAQSLVKYVHFLGQQKKKPVDYIIGLFDRYDIVVLCERFHPEVTQYDMIYELASDPRFQQQSGHIFTEIGSAALRPYVESFQMDDELSDKQVHERLTYIARNFSWGGIWEKTNIYYFLRKLHYLNRSLPKDRRVNVYPSDLDFPWEGATNLSWNIFNRMILGRRDKLMAENVIGKFNEIKEAPLRNKALVIMNYRHAFPHIQTAGKKIENTTGFLMAAYPGKVANVMINSVRALPESTDKHTVFTALQEGKWDAAFTVRGNPDLGFDFKGSPFGADKFDYFPIPSDLRYQDVFTGFVFFKPLSTHRMSMGLPGLMDQAFADELQKRVKIMGLNVTKEEIEEFGKVRVCGYEKSDCDEKIRQWLRAKP